MPRHPARFFIFLAALLPAWAHALGLGEIDLQSGLNQPFAAEIELTAESADELSAVEVRLASADAFKRYGLDRPAFMSAFRFNVTGGAGNPVIRVSSSDPVAEPFVTLLIEVLWPQGRLLREYTVLLDPPVYGAAPVRELAPAPVERPAPVTTPARPEPQPAPRPEVSTPARTSAPVSPPSRPQSADTYGPVQRNETLWAISKRARPDSSVDINQMMLAIYRANPDAFGGNINMLKQGAILRVPDREEIEVGRREAFSEVSRQNDEWRGARTAPEPEGGRLKLVPPVATPEPETVADSAASAEAEAVEMPAGAAIAEPDTDATQAAPAAETSGEPLTALQRRVQGLESELSDAERLIELRDQELSALQEQLARLRQDGAAAPAPAPQAPVETAAEAEPPVAASPPPTGGATTSTDEPSLIGSLLTNVWLYLGLAVAILGALFFARRRQQDELDDTGAWAPATTPAVGQEAYEGTEQMSAPGATDEAFVVEEQISGSDFSATDAALQAGGDDDVDDYDTDASIIEDREMPLEKTLSTDSPVNLDEADPIAEADFHMAYGLYDQAAELLASAREAQPERRDIHTKLLEVYFVWENKDEFLKEARAFHDGMEGGQDRDWNKVLIMGKQLCPDDSLFAGSASPSADIDLPIGDASSDDDGLDFSLDDGGDSDSVDFDLADGTSDDLDLELGDDDAAMGDDTREGSTLVDLGEGQTPTVETPTIETEGMGAATVETPTIETPVPESTMETPTIQAPGMVNVDETAEIELDDLGLDLTGLDEVAGEFDSEDDDSDGDITNIDEPAAIGDDDKTLLATELDADTRIHAPETAHDATSELDVSGVDFAIDDDQEHGGVLDGEATAEMQDLSSLGSDDADELDDLTGMFDERATEAESPVSGDTVQQPGPPAGGSVTDADEVFDEDLLSGSGDDADLDLELPDEQVAEADEPTGTIDVTHVGDGGDDGVTMTEVGTKLDLARAYIDMGDPDGARSILNEVLEEGEVAQRQEAQKLLDELSD